MGKSASVVCDLSFFAFGRNLLHIMLYVAWENGKGMNTFKTTSQEEAMAECKYVCVSGEWRATIQVVIFLLL